MSISDIKPGEQVKDGWMSARSLTVAIADLGPRGTCLQVAGNGCFSVDQWVVFSKSNQGMITVKLDLRVQDQAVSIGDRH